MVLVAGDLKSNMVIEDHEVEVPRPRPGGEPKVGARVQEARGKSW
jgi:hypothetical protein